MYEQIHEVVQPSAINLIMKVQAITEQDIRDAKCRGYNPSEWDRTISRFLEYKDCKFYMEIEGHYEYERFFATYQIPEGMILFKSVSYTSVMSSNGFCRIEILQDGTIEKHLFGSAESPGYADNSPSNRKILARDSRELKHIFTTEI